MVIGEPVQFFFSSQGEITQSTWAGDFKVRPILSFAAMARADAERRAFMGNPPEGEHVVGEEIRNIATMVSQIKMRVVEAPGWVKESGYLADFVDGNVLVELFKKLMDVEEEYRSKLSKQAEAAKAELK